MTQNLGTVADPTNVIEDLLASATDTQVSFDFSFLPYYDPNPQALQLFCQCQWQQGSLLCRIATDPAYMPADAINLMAPLRLEPVTVAKPWGAEIWHTGIEARGICSVQGTPLPWLIALNPTRLLGAGQRDPVLLKILAPFKEEIYGDLYLELHEQKIEVYVVTQLDATAWPEGRGQIRYGFCPERLQAFPSEAAFRQAYLDAVNDYRAIRTTIDAALDTIRLAQGYALDAPVAPAVMEAWRAGLDDGLNSEEQRCRTLMNEFTSLQDLEVGSVIQVQPLTPHSLQHGVRVIEFQSPHYERFILSFGQKVLTQPHWDSKVAIQRARLATAGAPEPLAIHRSRGCEVDQIVCFPQFEVHSIRLAGAASYQLALPTYGVLIGVEGAASIAGQTLGNEQSVLISGVAEEQVLTNHEPEGAVVLLAIPRQET
jgi:hypothetical protein